MSFSARFIFAVSLSTLAATSSGASSPGVAVPDAIPVIPAGSAYIQRNFASDVPGIADGTNPFLINPWGLNRTSTGPFCMANYGSGTASMYHGGAGGTAIVPTAGLSLINVPGGLPAGVVANTTSDFVITSGMASAPAQFLFASITGNIVGWHPDVPPGSSFGISTVIRPGHVYTGLAIGNISTTNYIYAADFANGVIEVFNGSFVLQSSASFPFADPTIPTTVGNTYYPYNIQNIGGSLYVSYAKVGNDGNPVTGVGNGFVRRFNMSGVRDLTFGINNGPLDAPWGMTLAHVSFGIFGGALLVGNHTPAGRIHAFNPATGAFLGTVQDEGGVAVEIDGLHALMTGNGVDGGETTSVYFTAGPLRDQHGLVGSLRPTTSSATALLEFSNADYFATESDGSISITVIRSGNTTGTATVHYAPLPGTEPGDATPGSDFNLAPGTLTFARGETSKTFTVAVLPDVLVEGDETIQIVLSNPTGIGQGLTSPTTATLLIEDVLTPPTLGDLQGDGKADLVWRDDASGADSAWLLDGAAVIGSAALPTVGPGFAIVGIGDFQGDGKTDILWRNAAAGSNVVWLMNCLTVAASAVLPSVPAPWTVAAVGDLQGDTKADIVWRNSSTGDNSVWFMDGLGMAATAALPSVGDTNFRIVATGDYQNDGKADLFWRNIATGANVVWLMNGSMVAASAVLASVPDLNWSVVGSGDFQEDGKDDVLWRNGSTGANVLWFMNGLSAPVGAVLPPVGDTAWKVARVGDFQGDGKADIVWRNTASGANAQWLMDGPAIALSSSLPSVPVSFHIAP